MEGRDFELDRPTIPKEFSGTVEGARVQAHLDQLHEYADTALTHAALHPADGRSRARTARRGAVGWARIHFGRILVRAGAAIAGEDHAHQRTTAERAA